MVSLLADCHHLYVNTKVSGAYATACMYIELFDMQYFYQEIVSLQLVLSQLEWVRNNPTLAAFLL